MTADDRHESHADRTTEATLAPWKGRTRPKTAWSHVVAGSSYPYMGRCDILRGVGTVTLSRSASDGCYEATRAAALSGVPKTTVYWWARNGIVVPSVSAVPEKLWSYADLMALRVVSWLRRRKSSGGDVLPASPMPKVRRALAVLDDLGLDPWMADSADRSPLLVDRGGNIYVRKSADTVLDENGTESLVPGEYLNLTAPFESDGVAGPNLLRPRPHLRIVPSKVAGEPHIEHSRLTTQTIAALAWRGYRPDQIADMYEEPVQAVAEAIDLERQLSGVRIAA